MDDFSVDSRMISFIKLGRWLSWGLTLFCLLAIWLFSFPDWSSWAIPYKHVAKVGFLVCMLSQGPFLALDMMHKRKSHLLISLQQKMFGTTNPQVGTNHGR
jgi:hypothetical protein